MSVNTQLERILTSPPLVSSPSLCRFLRFIVEETLAGRESQIKEHPLGVKVFDRGDDFNPRLDPIVRVQARNLRSRIAKYYDGPGANDPIRIELPKGTYVPIFHHLHAEAPLTAQAAPEPETQFAPPAQVSSIDASAEPQTVVIANATANAGSVMPVPPPRSPVADAPHALRPRFLLATVVVVVILASIAVLWITRIYAAPRHPDIDSLAQDLLIRGRYSLDRQTEGAIHESIVSFQQATARAPKFAPAYAALADAYNLLAQFGYITPAEGMEKAREAARKSLELNPKLAEGHVALAAVIEAYDWKWTEAEREYRKALELAPGLPAAHLWYGMFLRDQGRLKEALPELRRAAQLEPYSVLTSVNLAYALLWEGNSSAALEQATRASELAPELSTASLLLSHAARAASHTAQSDAALDKAWRSAAGNPHALSLVACELAKLGRREDSMRAVNELQALSHQRYVSPFDLGKVSLMLGDGDQALNLFEEAFRQRSSGMIFLRNTNASCVRDQSRFLSLIDKMHFKG
ncbi:MAG: Tetratricopeptide 2 repeat protein [Candidatus Solibacter sp.]|nr:Tetratricopeptide 2 repeat protein [Candidatus Solibacter sp.]